MFLLQFSAIWKIGSVITCGCIDNTSLDVFSLSRSSNGVCRADCSGQYCGVDSSANSLQGVAVFNNSRFKFVYSSCEEAFLMTTFPPNSSQIIDLKASDVTKSQSLQVPDQGSISAVV